MSINVKKMNREALDAAAEILNVDISEMSVADAKGEIATAIENLKADGSNAGLSFEQLDGAESVQALYDLVNDAEDGDEESDEEFEAGADQELSDRQAVSDEADQQAAEALGAKSDEDGFEAVVEGETPKAERKTKKVKIDRFADVSDDVIRGDVLAVCAKKNLPTDGIAEMNREQLIAKFAEVRHEKKAKKPADQPRAGRSLSVEQVHLLRRRRLLEHKGFPAIATEFGVSPMLARNIVKGNLYKDVPFETYTEEELDGAAKVAEELAAAKNVKTETPAAAEA